MNTENASVPQLPCSAVSGSLWGFLRFALSLFALSVAGVYYTLHDARSEVLPARSSHSAAKPVPPPAESTPQEGAAGKPSTGISPDGRVILNHANPDELSRLPGIGKKRAQAIWELRQRLGRFRKFSDLLRIRGIGPKLLHRISAAALLDPPDTEAAPR